MKGCTGVMDAKLQDEREAVRFPEWGEVLARLKIGDEAKEPVRHGVYAYLRWCKQKRTFACIATAKMYILEVEGAKRNANRPALRWFFKAAGEAVAKLAGMPAGGAADAKGYGGTSGAQGASSRASELLHFGVKPVSAGASVANPAGKLAVSAKPEVETASAVRLRGKEGRSMEPTLGANDVGASDWERKLVEAARRRAFSWRTEETYRMWAVRFARFIEPRKPWVAGGGEVQAFLSDLAVKSRASASTQKQALNALVFLMQEALGVHLGDMAFERAARRRTVPMVLSREETKRLLAELSGTPRLMAELAYGSGLRLMELLRLRVHHLDLERRQLKVFAGKGNKDRLTMVPESLIEPLRGHLERLRELFAADREAALPGVWLPEGLDRKYPKAGEQWEWQWLLFLRRPEGTRLSHPCATLQGQALTQAAA